MDLSHIAWRKSSRSTDQGNCVEIRVWHRSSRSTDNGGEPVKGAVAEPLFLARDSKNPDGPILAFSSFTWNALITSIKAGRQDLG
jgi:hypothetical protein